MKKLLRALKKAKSISDWKINVTETESCELFYVGKKLETNRATETEDYAVTVYIDKDGKRGFASFTYYPYMDEGEIDEEIKKALFAASFTYNDFFALPKSKGKPVGKSNSNLKRGSFNEIIGKVAEAVFKADKYEDGSLSATEIFLYRVNRRVINSQGVDVASISYRGNIETIPSWKRKGEEVELYDMISFETFDKKEITSKVKEALLQCKARSKAKKLNAKRLPSDVNVIIEDEEVEQVFSFFARDLSYSSKYQHMNFSEIGDKVQGEEVEGDKLNLRLCPFYQGAIASRFVDEDGVVLKEIDLIEDGVAKANHGSYQYGYYLKVEEPTGVLPIIVVKEGETGIEKMKEKPYLRCVKFSGMQLDPHSGFIGGEVRLGFYFDGKKEVPVTGFSISGDFTAIKGKIIYSKQTTTLPSYHGPKYLLLPDMKVI